MSGKKRTALLGYVAGILGLVTVVLVAWFWPELYTGWQDAQMFGESVVSTREQLQFLDMDSLSVEERLWLLKNRKQPELTWYDNSGIRSGFSDDLLERISHWKQMVWNWEENGLIPGGCCEMLEQLEQDVKLEQAWLWKGMDSSENISYDDGCSQWETYSVRLEESVLNVELVSIVSATHDASLTLLMDPDVDVIYYLSACGSRFWDDMARRLGPELYPDYASLAAAYGESGPELLYKEELENGVPGDFAKACGARKAELIPDPTGEPSGLACSIRLSYDKFDSIARVQPVVNVAGYGMAVSFGTPYWAVAAAEMCAFFVANGLIEGPGTMAGWLSEPYGVPEPWVLDEARKYAAELEGFEPYVDVVVETEVEEVPWGKK